jgi:hypothetical protein
MTTGHTQVADIIVPSVFTGMAMEETRERSELITSGILQDSGILTRWMAAEMGSGGGSWTLNRPTWNDLDASDSTGLERQANDSASELYNPDFENGFPVPQKITTYNEVAVRVLRNQHWSAVNLANDVQGTNGQDALTVIGARVGRYWARRLQKMALAVLTGVFADNVANDSADMVHDISGTNFVDGLTNFNAGAFYDALQTLGDADADIVGMICHSAVRNSMRKAGLLESVNDAQGQLVYNTYQGLRLVIDDGMPNAGGVYESFLFRAGALQYGSVAPFNAVRFLEREEAGNGNGSQELWNRVSWCIHPMGYAYTGTITNTVGGPLDGNTSTANTLAHADSWNRVAPERKQVGLIKLITREA